MASEVNVFASVRVLRGVGDKQGKLLESIGLARLWDLLMYFPRRYEDFSKTAPIREIQPNARVSVSGVLWQVKEIRTRRGQIMLQASVVDGSGVLNLTWFNQRYLKPQLIEGRTILASGDVQLYRGVLNMVNPAIVVADEACQGLSSLHAGRIVPIYRESAGLTSRWLRIQIAQAYERIGQHLKDRLPAELIQNERLIPLRQAIGQIHFPDDTRRLQRARERIGFEELFYW